MPVLLPTNNRRELPTELVEKILATKPRSPKRWKLAAAFWMAQHPENRREAYLVAEDCRQRRDASKNEFGTSGEDTANLRAPLCMPGEMLSIIEMADPGVFDYPEGKKNLHKMAKTFPEFCPVEKV